MKEITKQFLIANEFEDFNQVQKDVLAQVNLDRDLIVVAPTGTGKTHAFLFSVLEKLDVNQNTLQAIILSPTRELAMQTYDFAKFIYEVNKEVVMDLAIGGMDNKRLRKKLEHQPLPVKSLEKHEEQLSLFEFDETSSEIIEKLKAANVDSMTAREAMNFLWDLKDLL